MTGRFNIHISTLLLLILISCSGEKEQAALSAPPVESEDFARLLADVQVLESAYSIYFQKEDTSRKQMGDYYQQVFDKHKVSRELFENSIRWYAGHPGEMDKIYEQVSELLIQEQATLTGKKQKATETP